MTTTKDTTMQMLTSEGWIPLDAHSVRNGEHLCACGGRNCYEPSTGGVCVAEGLVNMGTKRDPAWNAVSRECGGQIAAENAWAEHQACRS